MKNGNFQSKVFTISFASVHLFISFFHHLFYFFIYMVVKCFCPTSNNKLDAQ